MFEIRKLVSENSEFEVACLWDNDNPYMPSLSGLSDSHNFYYDNPDWLKTVLLPALEAYWYESKWNSEIFGVHNFPSDPKKLLMIYELLLVADLKGWLYEAPVGA